MGKIRLTSGLLTLSTAGVMLLISACGGGGGSSSSGADTKTPPVASATTASPVHADNGVATKSPKAILAAVGKSLKHATTVHVHGNIPMGGKVGRFDLHIGTNKAQGTMSTPVRTSLVPIEIIAVHGKNYVKSRQLWKAVGGPTAAQLIGDRWGILPANGSASFKSFTTLKGMANSLLKPSGKLSRGAKRTLKGQPTIALKDSDGSIMYVATTGEPVVVRLVPPPSQAKPNEYLDFTEWNAPFTVTTPANAIDFSKLKH
jgi:hypothetical protein